MMRLNEQIREEIARQIVGGELEPGAPLPPERRLAEQMRVSKGVVREVTRSLEERGLVTVRHGYGTTVNDPDSWDLADPIVIDARLAGPEHDAVLAEALEVEIALEIQAARHGAAPGWIETMASALATSEAVAVDASDEQQPSDAYHDADLAFHRAILDATGNRTLAHTNRRFQRVLIAAARRRVHTPADVEHDLAEHRRILSAYIAKDADAAAKAVHDHLTAAAWRLRDRPRRG